MSDSVIIIIVVIGVIFLGLLFAFMYHKRKNKGGTYLDALRYAGPGASQSPYTRRLVRADQSRRALDKIAGTDVTRNIISFQDAAYMETNDEYEFRYNVYKAPNELMIVKRDHPPSSNGIGFVNFPTWCFAQNLAVEKFQRLALKPECIERNPGNLVKFLSRDLSKWDESTRSWVPPQGLFLSPHQVFKPASFLNWKQVRERGEWRQWDA